MKYTIILVVDETKKNILVCKRLKDPFKGKFNFVGGKIEGNETPIANAIRELKEETNISKSDCLVVKKLIDIEFYNSKVTMYGFGIILKHKVKLVNEIHPLSWISLKSDFANPKKFAGNGNMQMMVDELLSELK